MPRQPKAVYRGETTEGEAAPPEESQKERDLYNVAQADAFTIPGKTYTVTKANKLCAHIMAWGEGNNYSYVIPIDLLNAIANNETTYKPRS